MEEQSEIQNFDKEEIISVLNLVDRDMSKLIEWLERSDFFEAPASAKNHLAVTGGLAEHSLGVLKRLQDINQMMSLKLDTDSMIICGLLHDICKAYFYKTEKRNRKNKETGQCEEYDFYTYDDQFPIGHGEKSVIILQKHIDLTAHEALAIRWHMGAWRTDGFEGNAALGNACRLHPLVFALQMADQCATFWDETAEITI